MIVAMSTFRVANGLEAQVAAAFLNRPRLVDRAPGFLGMETFVSTKDKAIFHLITRWTDVNSFRIWHRSAAHHKSHEFIPAGLKLDASYTQVLEMERLADGEQPTASFQEIVADQNALLSSFLSETESVYFLAASPDGRITACNRKFARRMRCSSTDLIGQRIWPLLTEHDAGVLQERIERAERTADKFVLNFVDASQSPYSLVCMLDILPCGFVLMGEEPKKQDDALRDELVQLNNEMAVLMRENSRKKRELQTALEELKQAQAMLVQREKMASLGQMTAGVAHEINNPVSFVLSNETTLQRDFEGLLSLINLVGDSLNEIARFSPALKEDILEKATAIDLTYVAEAVPRKLADNLEGLERVKKLVLDLRNFSHLDEDVLKSASVAKGILSTLRFLGQMIREHQVSVKTEFGEMPDLQCSPGQLNQVFSNVIANAVQASAPGQEVKVSTGCEGGICTITVEDHGAGISRENLPRVFDPFFTTKPVGAGTGLGLHIARQIVIAHSGEIQISSEQSEGTRVRIAIPLKREEKSDSRE